MAANHNFKNDNTSFETKETEEATDDTGATRDTEETEDKEDVEARQQEAPARTRYVSFVAALDHAIYQELLKTGFLECKNHMLLEYEINEVFDRHYNDNFELMKNLHNIGHAYYEEDIKELLEEASKPQADIHEIRERIDECYCFAKYCCLLALQIPNLNPREAECFYRNQLDIFALLTKINVSYSHFSQNNTSFISARPGTVLAPVLAEEDAPDAPLSMPQALTVPQSSEAGAAASSSAASPSASSSDSIQLAASLATVQDRLIALTITSPRYAMSPLLSPETREGEAQEATLVVPLVPVNQAVNLMLSSSTTSAQNSSSSSASSASSSSAASRSSASASSASALSSPMTSPPITAADRELHELVVTDTPVTPALLRALSNAKDVRSNTSQRADK